jgi:hypothetical protein
LKLTEYLESVKAKRAAQGSARPASPAQ